MMHKGIIGIVFIFLGLTNSKLIYAQDDLHPGLPVVWNLQLCLDYAKKNNIQISSARLNSLSSEEQLLLAKAARTPGLSGAVSQYYTHGSNSSVVQKQFSSYGNYSLNAGWVLYNGGYINDVIRQNQLDVRSAQLTTMETENSITLQIAQSYLIILEAKENILYIKDLLATSQAQLKQGQQRYDAGSIALKDLASLQAQLAADNYTLVAANNALRQNKLILKQLLQLPVYTAFDIPQPDTITTPASEKNLADAEKEAMQSRPEIENSKLGVQIAQLGLLEARAQYKPVLGFSGILSSGYSSDISNPYFRQFDNNFFQSAGLNLSIPLFTKRLNKTNVELAKINVQQAVLSLKDVSTTLSQAIEQAYISVQNAQSQYDAAAGQLTATRESYRISSEELKIGGINIVDYLVQKNLYVQALQLFIQAKYSKVISLKIYEFYTGIPISL